MLMTEVWKKWALPETLPAKSFGCKTLDSENGLTVFLMDQSWSEQGRICFERGLLAYRVTDEGKRLKLMASLDKTYGTAFYAEAMFFQVEQSEYLEWFNEQTFNSYDSFKITHYVVLSANEIVEVLATQEPTITVRANLNRDKIATIINAWDPINLLSHAPTNEYEMEILRISDLLRETNQEEELAGWIYEVFRYSFGPTVFKRTYEDCLRIARELIETGYE